MNDWLAFGIGLVLAVFLCGNGLLMLFDLKRFLALHDWLTRADRWGSRHDPNRLPEDRTQWRVAGVAMLGMGIVVGGTLVLRLTQGRGQEALESAKMHKPIAIAHWIGLILPLSLVCLGLWIILKPRSFVRWTLQAREDRLYPPIDLERMSHKELIGIRVFGAVFLIGGVAAAFAWYKGG